MGRFREIEGLRAWLAWTVVISHLFVVLSYYDYGAAYLAPLAGEYAVKVFILISGFVIAGLILEQKEPWRPFIVRRAFRIFPAYFVALIVGAITTPLALSGLAETAWGGDPNSYYFRSMQEGLASTNAWPWAHWPLHLTLLQGVVPDSILPWSSAAFVGPAWSLSLEWQFYLVAPALVWAMRSPKWAVLVALIAFICAELFQRGVFGVYNAPSSLLGGLWLFVIGIASRLAFPALKATPIPVAATVLALVGIGVLAQGILPVLLWIAFVVLLSRAGHTHPTDGVIAAAAKAMLASPLAMALGARSYSVYIIHIPIMKLLLFLLPLQAMTQVQALGWLTLTSIPMTLIVSEFMYRYVERPMIRAGAQLASAHISTKRAGRVAEG